tara:strand:- start:40 stop:558 length:519 start_codon:yes stop_codon:yes gene_type:complete
MGDLKVNEIKTDAIKNVAATTAATINSSGIITKPTNPAFYARPSSNQNNIAINQWVNVLFGNIITNQGSHFADPVFTAPVTGIYHLSTYVRIDNVDTAATYYLLGWLIAGAALQVHIIDPNFTSDLSYGALNSSLTYHMTASQTAQVRIWQANGTSQSDIITDSYFSGHLVG